MKRLSFSQSFVLAFVVGIVALGTASSRAFRERFVAEPIPELEIDRAMREAVPAGWVATDVTNPTEGKRRHTFWAEATRGTGVALRGMDVDDIFAALFPGYDRVSFARNIAAAYFEHKFDQPVWIPALSSRFPFGAAAYLSWIGCVRVFAEWGADVVVLGNSEVNEGHVPEALARELSGAIPNGKVLNCAGPAKSTETLTALAEAMAEEARAPVKWVILGIDPATFTSSPIGTERNRHKDIRTLISRRDETPGLWSHLMAFRPAEHFPRVGWEAIYPPSFGEVNFHLKKGRASPAGERYFTYAWGAPVPEGSPLSPDSLASLARRVASESQAPTDQPPCDAPDALARLNAALAASLSLAERALVYLPPVTELKTGLASPERTRCVKEQLLARASDRVRVLTADWSHYGLSHADYLYQLHGENGLRLNVNHTNFRGALKVTHALAREILAAQSPLASLGAPTDSHRSSP